MKLSNGWTDWHHIWYTAADSSANGHRLNTIRPSIPQAALGRGLEGNKCKKSGEAVKRLDRLAPNLAHMCRFIWDLNCPSRHKGWFRGSDIKKSGGSFQMAGPIRHQLWFTSADSSGNGHRLNTICPSLGLNTPGAF